MAFFLGMDVGGTKTLCAIADSSGAIVGFGRSGCGSYEYYGAESALKENRKAVDEALESAGVSLGEITAVGLGVAGADLPEDFEMLEEAIYTPIFGQIPRAFKNDSMAGLRGGTQAGHGIVIVCGTGSVCAGRNAAGEETRVGGLGPEFGDACTGTMLGEEGLRAVWRARDGITPPTLLTDKFLARSGCATLDEFFRRVYRKEMGREELEPMARLVFESAAGGDPAACDILERGGHYLSMMVNAVAKRLAMTGVSFDLVMAGSVFRGECSVLIDALQSGLAGVCPRVRCVLPMYEPVVGAVLMAMEQIGPLDPAVTNSLEQRISEAEERFGIQLKAS